MEILNIWKNYFDIELDEQDIDSDSDEILSYSIYSIIPAELKIKSTYCELNKKGKVTLIPVVLEEDDRFSSDKSETKDTAETKTQSESETETTT